MDPSSPGSHSKSRLLALTVGAIGVVYGDIGTSPLYALKECFSEHYHLQSNATNVLGILSLIFWAITLIICVKYLAIVMRFDNKGEGGILALMELVSERSRMTAKLSFIFVLGLFGACLMYGDGIITPAISVLSAVEGLTVAAPPLQNLVIPITIVILFALFYIQRRGTETVGRIFGPFMILWFSLLGVLGCISLCQSPEVLQAINPAYAWNFITLNGSKAFYVLGSVVLVVTGGEALYADMGHFGRKPITRGWFMLVYPTLIFNYFGQGALLLREGTVRTTVDNPFFHMVPSWGVIPLVILATFAAVIASQAVISGAFSITWQALQLGYLPRLQVLHTSHSERGQIYIPFVNWALFACTVVLVMAFKNSSSLAAAYGIAVTGTMVITSILTYFAMRRRLNWSWIIAGTITAVFLIMDGAFFGANLVKVAHGGYVPLILGAVIFMLMITWHRGRNILRDAIQKRNKSLDDIINRDIELYEVVPGTALYMNGYPGTAPPALVTNVKVNRCRHETIILLSVMVKPVAHIGSDKRFEVSPLEKGFYQVILRYGFMDEPNLMADLMYLPEYDIPVDITDATFVLGHESVTIRDGQQMWRWRKAIFVFMHRNSRTPVRYFGIPVKRALEIGAHIEI